VFVIFLRYKTIKACLWGIPLAIKNGLVQGINLNRIFQVNPQIHPIYRGESTVCQILLLVLKLNLLNLRKYQLNLKHLKNDNDC
jgi:hypothetical protein